jgi:hypothetical protein
MQETIKSKTEKPFHLKGCSACDKIDKGYQDDIGYAKAQHVSLAASMLVKFL